MPRRPFLAPLVFAASLCLFHLTPATAEVKLPPVLSSHMVLQRDMPLPIWGTAAPGEKVTVSFRDQEKSATADPQGKWLVKLDPLKAGGPDTMKIAGANTLTLDDVLVGEVWVGSGQSNMAGGVAGYAKNDEVLAKLAAANYPSCGSRRAAPRAGRRRHPRTTGGSRRSCSPLACALHQELDVPVGLMVGAVGGTPSGFWLSQEAYESDAACKEAVQKLAAAYSGADAEKKYEQDLQRWEKAAAEAKQKGAKPPRKPDLPLKPGECRGKVGHLYEAHIRPFIPYGIRGVLWDQGESGTAISGVDQYTLMGALIRGWRKEWGQGDFPFIYIQKPSGGGCAWDPADPVTAQGRSSLRCPRPCRARRTDCTSRTTSASCSIRKRPWPSAATWARACIR